MRIAGIEPDDFINGEGISVSLWMQGCPFHCKGCHNPETWDFNSGTYINIFDLCGELVDLITRNGIQRNFSVLGGEPLAPGNRELLFEILRFIKIKFRDIKIFVWTGYELENLPKDKLGDIDVLITGRYIEEERDITLKWRGSRNQKILYKGIDF